MLGAAGIVATFLWLGEGLSSLTLVPFWAIAVGAGLTVFNYLCGGLRIALLTRIVGTPVGFWRGLRAYAIGLFSAAITPGGGAQAPAVVLSLLGDRVPAPRAWSVTVYVWILDLFFLIWSVPIGLAAISRVTGDLLGMSPLLLGALLSLVFLFLLALLLFRQNWLKAIVLTLMRLRWLRRWRDDAVGFMDRLAEATSVLWHGGFAKQLVLHAATAGLYIATYFTFYVVAVGVGGNPRLMPALAAVQLPMVISFVFPTPGGSGILEILTASLFAAEGNSPGVGAAILAWRVLTFYSRYIIGPALGGTALFHRRKDATTDGTDTEGTGTDGTGTDQPSA